METVDLAQISLARFSPGQRPLKVFPHSIRWENGTVATKDDFGAHILDTYAITGDVKKGMEIQIFPNIVAEVSFDARRAAWFMSGPAVIPATLDLTDRNAPDDQIIARLSPHLVRYKCTIHRH